MVRTHIIYQGQKHCELIHEPSQSKIETDAPKDNQGLGKKFSPTDLLGAALGSCILTTMALVAERDGFSILGAQAVVEKVMADAPRRVQALKTSITLPAALSTAQRKKIEVYAHSCPVRRSLNQEIEVPVEFLYS